MHQQRPVQAGQNTVLLLWGLLDDLCCSAKPLTADPHSNCYGIPLDGWNVPTGMLLCAAAASAQQISLGWTHALLLTEQGEAYVALANRVLTNARAPTGIYALKLPSATSASPGSSSPSSIWQPVRLLNHGLASGSLASAVTIKQVAAGDHHCLLLDGSGCVWAMGSNRHGQLGLSSAQQAAAAAVEATAPAAAAGGEDAAAAEDLQEQQIGSFVAVLGPGSGSSVQVQVQQVAAGACHSIAVTATLGRLYAWGWNAHGQCGTGSTADVQQPTLCTALDGVPLACAAAGMAHTVAASRDGAVYAWGCGNDGQLGLSAESAPTTVIKPEGVGGVAGGSAARGDGAAGGVGSTACKQQPRSSLLPVLVEDEEMDQEDVVQVSCGSRHTVALTATGRVFAWGLNKHGQCCTAAGTGVAKRAAAEAAAAATTASALTWDTSFEVQTITAPRPVDLRNTVICPFFHPQGSVAAMEGSELAGHRDARKLAECGKVIAVRAGRWHTMVEFCLLIS